MWFQNYKSCLFSSSLHSIWSLCRRERWIGAKCWIWKCSKALWCMRLFPLFPLLAFIKYLCKTRTCVLKTTLVPNGVNPSLLSGQKHLFTFHPITPASNFHHSWGKSWKLACLYVLKHWTFFRFLKIEIENEAEQQMFCGLIRNTCLRLCPVAMHTRMAANSSFDWQIKSRTEGPIIEV